MPCCSVRLPGKKLEIRFVPAPRENQDQGQAPPQRLEKTLHEQNEMDPYDFAVRNATFGVVHGSICVFVRN